MKRIVYYCGAFLTALMVVGLVLLPHNTHGKSLFQENGAPTEQLRRVFEHLGVPIETLAQANEFAQKNLLRAAGTERWDAQAETPVIQTIRAQEKLLRQDLRALGMLDEIAPAKKDYAYAHAQGALRERVATRLEYLAELEQQGHHFETVALLSGERPLRDVEKEGLPASIATEAQMMAYIYEHQHQKPTGQKELLVNASMVQKADGSLVRPNTDDTYVHFARIAPHDGSCLVISNQPYVTRQTLVGQRLLNQSHFPTEGAGKGVAEGTGDIVMFMDEFARTLYEVYQQAKLQKA